jgi:hypothetical protein
MYVSNGGTAMTIDSVNYVDLTTDTGVSAIDTIALSGTRSGISCSANDCVLLGHQITRRYRGGHPRNYLPLGDAALQDNPQQWDTAFVANVLSSWTNVVLEAFDSAGGGASNVLPLNVSYRSGGAPRIAPVVDIIHSSSVDVRICSQRRRLGKGPA